MIARIARYLTVWGNTTCGHRLSTYLRAEELLRSTIGGYRSDPWNGLRRFFNRRCQLWGRTVNGQTRGSQQELSYGTFEGQIG